MVLCAFLCNLHLIIPSLAPALDASIFHFTKEKTKALFCASGTMYLIYKKAFQCKAVRATALQTLKCEEEI